MPVSFQIDAVFLTVPDEQVDLLLAQLDRPSNGQAGTEARAAAEIIRRARGVGTAAPIASFKEQYAPAALLAAIDDVQRGLGVSPPRELRALRTLLRRAL